MRVLMWRVMAIIVGSQLAASAKAEASPIKAPVGISDNHRYFVDGNGNPCFWLGDTHGVFLAVKSDEAQAIMKDRQKEGFNAIQVMLLGVGGGKKANVAGEKPFLNDDVSTPNEAYFRNVDTLVETAERLSLVLVIGIYHKAPDSGKMITGRNARAYGAWIGRRYREAPNVIWSMYPEAKPAYVPVVRELAAGLAEGDGKRHLVTVHPDPAPASSSCDALSDGHLDESGDGAHPGSRADLREGHAIVQAPRGLGGCHPGPSRGTIGQTAPGAPMCRQLPQLDLDPPFFHSK